MRKGAGPWAQGRPPRVTRIRPADSFLARARTRARGYPVRPRVSLREHAVPRRLRLGLPFVYPIVHPFALRERERSARAEHKKRHTSALPKAQK